MTRNIVLAGILILLAGCNTVDGIGRDLSAAGRALSGAANDVSQSPPHQVSGEKPPCDPGARYVRDRNGRLRVESLAGGTGGLRPCSADIEQR